VLQRNHPHVTSGAMGLFWPFQITLAPLLGSIVSVLDKPKS
jgi:hypothetical protein